MIYGKQVSKIIKDIMKEDYNLKPSYINSPEDKTLTINYKLNNIILFLSVTELFKSDNRTVDIFIITSMIIDNAHNNLVSLPKTVDIKNLNSFPEDFNKHFKDVILKFKFNALL